MRERNPRRRCYRSEFLGVMEIGRPATGPGLDKRPDALGFTSKARIGLQPGHHQGRAREVAAQDSLPPVQPGLLEFQGMVVGA